MDWQLGKGGMTSPFDSCLVQLIAMFILGLLAADVLPLDVVGLKIELCWAIKQYTVRTLSTGSEQHCVNGGIKKTVFFVFHILIYRLGSGK